MRSFKINTPFTAFERDYPHTRLLVEDDLACWPEDGREQKLAELIATGRITPEPVVVPAPGAAPVVPPQAG